MLSRDTCLFSAKWRNAFLKLPFWLQNFGFAFLFIFLCSFVFLSSSAQAVTLKTLQLQWSYDTSQPGLAGYRIYHNGAFLNEIDDPSSLNATLDVWLTDGTNDFTMTAFDASGNESAQSATYVIENTQSNQSPTAIIQADVLSGDAPLTVSFDGRGSSDPDGSIVKYFWETGDGASYSADSFSYTYLASGTYTVRLTVTDNLGATASSTVVIMVTDPSPLNNIAPTAVIDASVQAGLAPLAVSFDGSYSSDPDGSIASYHWDFGDGQVGSGAQVSHDFTEAGEYTITLTVTDNGGKTAASAAVVSVAAQLPSPVITAEQSQQLEWSYDTSRPGLAGYRIYDNGQLVVTINNPLSLSADIGAYLIDGTNSITMTAFDAEGNESAPSNSFLVTLQTAVPNQPPSANIQADILTGEAPLAVTLDGTDSSDVDGTILGFRWDFGDGEIATGSNVSHTYVTPGTYTVRLTVTDDQNAQGSASIQIDVVAPASPIDNANNPPVAVDDSVVVDQDSDVLIEVISNDGDADGDPLTVVSVSQPADGAVSIRTNGILYSPNPGYHGKDGFSYTVSDGKGGTAMAQVDIRVSPVNSNSGRGQGKH